MTKKGGLGIWKNFLKDLQQFLSFPTSPGYKDPPPKCNPNFGLIVKKSSMNSQNKSIFTTKENEKQLINKTQLKDEFE